MPNPSLPVALATAILAGEATVEGVTERLGRVLGRQRKWMRPLARRYLQTYAGQTRPRHKDVVRFLLHDKGFTRFQARNLENPSRLAVVNWLTVPQQMQPVAVAKKWQVPAIESIAALAEWLRLGPEDLEWFADLRGLGYRHQQTSKLSHYHYRVVVKPSGGFRLIEAPKPRLKQLQRGILAILDRVPIHPAVHGFRRRRSIKTFAQPHTGQQVLLRMDLRDFFPSVSGARVQTLFRTMGYPESVADLLGGICTNATPRGVWRLSGGSHDGLREARELHARPHLPQGAATSPSLANLCFYKADCRLAGLAKSAGAIYTRYADDLAFSGSEDFARRVSRFSAHAAAILLEEGFSVNHHKTRTMRPSVRQHLTGLTTNQQVNVKRKDFDDLKAMLTNCARRGPEAENRQAHPRFRSHLEGRVAFVEMINPGKGKRLRAIFDRILWK